MSATFINISSTEVFQPYYQTVLKSLYDSPVYNPLFLQLGFIDNDGDIFPAVKSVYWSLYSSHHAKALQTVTTAEIGQPVS